MKDKLRELAERWKADADKYPVPTSNEGCGYSNALYDCADDLLSILDAEGDGAGIDEDVVLMKWPNGSPKWGYIKIPKIGKQLVERKEAEQRIAALERFARRTP